MGSLLGTALARAQDFLLEPADPYPPFSVAREGRGRPIDVSVLGTCAGCGVSTIASGLRLVLASSISERIEVVDQPGTAVVLVTPGSGHPQIAGLVGSLMKERVGKLVLVANKVSDEARWRGHADLCVPESRLGAALLAHGRRPPGPFGSAIARLAALVEHGVAV